MIRPSKKSRTTLQFEKLEARCLLAGGVTAFLKGGVLRVQGTSRSDQISITETNGGIQVGSTRITGKGTKRGVAPEAAINSIIITPLKGSDVIKFKSPITKSVTVNGSKGPIQLFSNIPVQTTIRLNKGQITSRESLIGNGTQIKSTYQNGLETGKQITVPRGEAVEPELIAGALKTVYGETPAGVTVALKSADVPAVGIARSLFQIFNSKPSDMASLLRATGFDARDIAQALWASGFPFSSLTGVASAMTQANYSRLEIADGLLNGIGGLNADAVSAALYYSGSNHMEDVAAILQQVGGSGLRGAAYGLWFGFPGANKDLNRVASVLRGLGASPAAVADAIYNGIGIFNIDEAAAALYNSGSQTMEEVAAAINDVPRAGLRGAAYGLWFGFPGANKDLNRVASVLRGLGASPAAVADAIYNGIGIFNIDEAAAALYNSGSQTMEEVAAAINDVPRAGLRGAAYGLWFGFPGANKDLNRVASVLRGLGASPAAVADAIYNGIGIFNIDEAAAALYNSGSQTMEEVAAAINDVPRAGLRGAAYGLWFGFPGANKDLNRVASVLRGLGASPAAVADAIYNGIGIFNIDEAAAALYNSGSQTMEEVAAAINDVPRAGLRGAAYSLWFGFPGANKDLNRVASVLLHINSNPLNVADAIYNGIGIFKSDEVAAALYNTGSDYLQVGITLKQVSGIGLHGAAYGIWYGIPGASNNLNQFASNLRLMDNDPVNVADAIYNGIGIFKSDEVAAALYNSGVGVDTVLMSLYRTPKLNLAAVAYAYWYGIPVNKTLSTASAALLSLTTDATAVMDAMYSGIQKYTLDFDAIGTALRNAGVSNQRIADAIAALTAKYKLGYSVFSPLVNGTSPNTFAKFTPGVPAVKGAGDSLAASFDDIFQDQTGTCFLLSSLAAVAYAGVDLSTRITYAGTNLYNVQLYEPIRSGSSVISINLRTIQVFFNGTWDGSDDPKPSAEGDFWPILFQRAYLSMFPNDKAGGSVGFALMALTGKSNDSIPDSYWRYNGKIPKAGTADQYYILNALATHKSIVAATLPNAESNQGYINVYNIALSHAYTVLSINNIGVSATVRLRNPWGTDGPLGTIDGVNDGIIELTWTVFSTLFSEYYIATA